MQIDADAFADAFQFHMTEQDLSELMMSMSNTQSANYDSNLEKLGYVDFDEPGQISIYPKDFDNKEKVVKLLDDYNQRMEKEGKDEQVISYTDVVGTLMSSVTDISGYDQLCTDCICGHFAGGFFHYDRCHYVHQRVGA